MTDAPRPPAHLKKPGRALWRGILKDYLVDEHHDLARLQVACECADRVDEARQAIERDGAFVEGRFGPKSHPALAVEKDNKALLLRAVREMGIDLVNVDASRPPSRWRGK